MKNNGTAALNLQRVSKTVIYNNVAIRGWLRHRDLLYVTPSLTVAQFRVATISLSWSRSSSLLFSPICTSHSLSPICISLSLSLQSASCSRWWLPVIGHSFPLSISFWFRIRVFISLKFVAIFWCMMLLCNWYECLDVQLHCFVPSLPFR